MKIENVSAHKCYLSYNFCAKTKKPFKNKAIYGQKYRNLICFKLSKLNV